MKLRSIQVLRGLTATSVVVHHAGSHGVPVVGAAGVDVFFVISGFIMATVAAGRRPAEFLFDRVWRIYPLWLIALLPWLMINAHAPTAIVASMTLWPFYGASPILRLGWTLTFEVMFYVGFALALATRKWMPLALFAACLPFCDSSNTILSQVGSPIIVEFLAGVALARLKPARNSIGLALVALGLAWFILAPTDHSEIVTGSAAVMRLVYWGAPAAMLVQAARSLERHFSHSVFDPLILLGNASYSIYLFHALVTFGSHSAASFVMAMILGIMAHLLIERPIIRAKKYVAPLVNIRRKDEIAADSHGSTTVLSGMNSH